MSLDDLHREEEEILLRRAEAQRRGNVELFDRLTDESLEVRKLIFALTPSAPTVKNDPEQWRQSTEVWATF